MSRSRNSRKTSQRYRGIEWGAKRLGDKYYNGIPGSEQKRITSSRERMAEKQLLLQEGTLNEPRKETSGHT